MRLINIGCSLVISMHLDMKGIAAEDEMKIGGVVVIQRYYCVTQNWRRCCDICITTGAGCPLCMRAPRRQCVQRYNLHGKASLSLSRCTGYNSACTQMYIRLNRKPASQAHGAEREMKAVFVKRSTWAGSQLQGAVRHFVRLCRQNIVAGLLTQ